MRGLFSRTLTTRAKKRPVPKRPRGFVDLWPEQLARKRAVTDAMARSVKLRGFEEVELPLLESTAVFERGLGEDSEVVGKQMFSFETQGGDSLTLRPEGTAGLVRALLTKAGAHAAPGSAPPAAADFGAGLRLFYSGPFFRYERPQRGRQRQFHQFGVEHYGCASPESDAEAIEMAVAGLAGVPVGPLFSSSPSSAPSDPPTATATTTSGTTAATSLLPQCTVLVNSLGDAETRATYTASLRSFLEEHRSALSEDSRRRLERPGDGGVLRVLDSKAREDAEVVNAAPLISDFYTAEAGERFERVMVALERMLGGTVEVSVDPRLVRGLDYYSHSVFEIVRPVAVESGGSGSGGGGGSRGNGSGIDNKGSGAATRTEALLAGGRYDGLFQEFGAPRAVPAFGWAAGVERVVAAAEDVSATCFSSSSSSSSSSSPSSPSSVSASPLGPGPPLVYVCAVAEKDGSGGGGGDGGALFAIEDEVSASAVAAAAELRRAFSEPNAQSQTQTQTQTQFERSSHAWSTTSLRARVHTSFEPGSLRRHLRAADRLGAAAVAMAGAGERERRGEGASRVRCMRTGEEWEVGVRELADVVERLIG